MLIVALAVTIALIATGSSGSRHRSPIGHALPRAAHAATPAAARPATAPRTRPRAPAPARLSAAPEPGSLPQTHTYPAASGTPFTRRMAALWSGIAEDSTIPAVAAFIPERAYIQLKAIASGSSDWTDRLMHDYSLDIHAAHALLGAGARALD